MTTATEVGIKVLAAVAFWVIGRWLIGVAVGMVRASLERQKVDPTVLRYVGSIVTVTLNILLVIGILGYFGIQTTTFAALFAAAGVAIGMAWSGLLANFALAIALSAFARDEDERKAESHRWLVEQTALPPRKRRWIPLIAILLLLWLWFAAGPGAVLGNSLFGDPDDPLTWRLGVPSIWVWQLGGWASGVGLLALLAYYLEFGVAAPVVTQPNVSYCKR